MPKYGCPNCKSDDNIWETNTVLADYHILAFAEDRGKPEPCDWGDSEVAWETAEVISGDRMARYFCKNCNTEFQEPTLLETTEPKRTGG